MTYSREDVETRGGNPAANVKVYLTIQDAWGVFKREENPDERFAQWLGEHVTDEYLDAIFWIVCGFEFEYLKDWAEDRGKEPNPLFPGYRVEVWQEGRSGGWAVVHGLPDVETWDAVLLARWRRFERIARDIADGVPHQVLCSLYLNEFESWREEQDDAASYNAELPVDLHRA